jgi:archaellum component FlaD/FlaE
MEDLADEHRTLFGKPMSRVELVSALQEEVKRTGNGNIGLREVFEKKFNVAGKREEVREAEVQRRITDAVKARETAMADEYALRSTNQPAFQNDNPSPIFASLRKEGDKPTHVAGVPEAVVASIAAFRKIRADRHVA